MCVRACVRAYVLVLHLGINAKGAYRILHVRACVCASVVHFQCYQVSLVFVGVCVARCFAKIT
jgi:hypothetical protein